VQRSHYKEPKVKRLLLILAIMAALTFNAAMAENGSKSKEAKRSNGGPMAVFKQASPMPLLMSVIVKNADKFGLSEEQHAIFAQWRVGNMASSMQIGNAILAEEKAINQAALDGKPKADIEKLLSSVLDKRQELAISMLTCRDLMMQTLDAAQWEKLVTIYNSKK